MDNFRQLAVYIFDSMYFDLHYRYIITLVLYTHNPFFTKKAVFNQKLELVLGDPPEVKIG